MNKLPTTISNAEMTTLISIGLFEAIEYDPTIDGYAVTPNYAHLKPETPRYIGASADPMNWYREDAL